MASISLTNDWQLAVTAGEDYLMQAAAGKGYLVKLGSTTPTDSVGSFKLGAEDSLSSIVLPSNMNIYVKKFFPGEENISITIATW